MEIFLNYYLEMVCEIIQFCLNQLSFSSFSNLSRVQNMSIIKIEGVIATGEGQATSFTQLDWAADAFLKYLNIRCYPGTVNIKVISSENLLRWSAVKKWSGIVLPPPESNWCASRAWHTRINNKVFGAIILPEIGSYPENKIELISAVSVRRVLNLMDNDEVFLEVTDSTKAFS